MQNILIAGFGFMGGMHAQVYAKLKAAKLVAVVDANRKAAAAQARQLKLDLPIYPDLPKALREHPVDVVDICLPTHLHATFVRRALEARKHIFCEKPLVASASDALALAAAAERAGVKMQIGHCLRFWPEYQALVTLVRKRRAGRLLSLSLQRRCGRPTRSIGDWLNQPRLSGGAALDLHIHDTDFVHHLLGRPQGVTSIGTKDRGGWSHIFTTYHFDDVAVTAEGGWNYPPQWGFQMAFQAVFERFAVEFDSGSKPTLAVSGPAEGRKPLAFTQPRAGTSQAGAGNIATLGGYFNELAYFIDCLEHDRTPQIATPRQAADSVRTVMAEIRSAQTGRTIRL